MVSIPPYSDPGLAAAYKVSEDIELYIRINKAQREQPADCTYRLVQLEAQERGMCFDPFIVGLASYMNYGLPVNCLYYAFRLYNPKVTYEGSFDRISK
ncbi:unnamed protein product [Clonostachys byssicola]|uniref:Uncharacterized protein n=1 Tax=Clonostachys byssicola TaxID=160290 RepID=A0A9N9UIH3_9HYPO|nr:unnamed protein product [Clonostachys byssicola]